MAAAYWEYTYFDPMVFREPQMTYWSEYAVGLSQSLRYVVDRAEHQGADNSVYRLVRH